MADLLATGMAWLGAQLKAHASRDVVYRRGTRSVTVKAIVGRTELEAADVPDFSTAQRVESRDFLIDAIDLDFGDGPLLPERGDRISETLNGKTYLYEVMPFGIVGESHWRYADEYGRSKLRIHAKLIDTMDDQ